MELLENLFVPLIKVFIKGGRFIIYIFRLTSIIAALTLLLTACTQEKSPEENENETAEKEVSQEVEEKEEPAKEDKLVVTKDNAVTFELINLRDASTEELNKFKKEVLEAYLIVKDSIETDYTPAENIRMFLKKGTGNSTGYRRNMKLLATDMEYYPLVHEMTHTILGYGKNFDATRGYFTQEGFGSYMEEKHGNLLTVNYGVTSDKFMRYLISMEKNIPISNLMDLDSDDSYFRPVINDQKDSMLQSMSYMHAGSFVGYLIETYGMEKFEKVYNKADFVAKLENVYGKSIEVLEKEWLTHIKNTEKITDEEKARFNNLDQINTMLESMDAELFN